MGWLASGVSTEHLAAHSHRGRIRPSRIHGFTRWSILLPLLTALIGDATKNRDSLSRYVPWSYLMGWVLRRYAVVALDDVGYRRLRVGGIHVQMHGLIRAASHAPLLPPMLVSACTGSALACPWPGEWVGHCRPTPLGQTLWCVHLVDPVGWDHLLLRTLASAGSIHSLINPFAAIYAWTCT